MLDVSATLQCLAGHLDKPSLLQLSLIAQTLLTMTGRVTMLGLSRWTEKGASYRNIQNWNTEIQDILALLLLDALQLAAVTHLVSRTIAQGNWYAKPVRHLENSWQDLINLTSSPLPNVEA